MGATVDIPEPQSSRLVAQAEREGLPVGQLLLRCIERQLPLDQAAAIGDAEPLAAKGKFKIPLIPSTRPGTFYWITR
jgi:hypothetical protein